MPDWSEAPEKELDNTLREVLEGLEDEISDNPTFDVVTGVPLEKMIPHATEAITQVFGNKYPQSNLEDLIQAYAMGFVVGQKFAIYKKEPPRGAE